MMRSNSIFSWIITTSIFLILYITNPKEYQLKHHLKETFTANAKGEGGFSGAIKELFAGPEAWLMSLTTERHNLMFFSIFEIEGLSKKHVYIGVLNNFIELPHE
jgi:hypothetical protein